MSTEFEQRIADITRNYCLNSSGEDAAGKRDALASFLCSVMAEAGIQVRNVGGDPDYLPDEDAIFRDVSAAMQDAIDMDEIRRERAVA